mgnify:CR=1 FL=1
MEKFILEIPTIYRENDAINFINEFDDNTIIEGDAKLHNHTKKYGSWLLKLVKNCDLDIPSKTYFLTRENDNKIIGITTINFKQKENYENIKYSISPLEKDKEYDKTIISLILKECKNEKINELIISCDRENINKAKAIISLGGKVIKEKFTKNEYIDLYKININETLEN